MLLRRSLFVSVALLSALAAPGASDIGAPAAIGSVSPFLFATRDALLLSWLEPVAGTQETALRLAIYRDGRWSAPRTIARRGDFIVNWADFPSIVQDAQGTLFAHWLQKTGEEDYDVRIAISKDGGAGWSVPLLMNREGRTGEHGFVTLAPLAGGGVGATWLGDMALRYATIDAAGSIGSEAVLDDRTCECCTTGMSMAGGRPVIAYRDRSPQEIRDIAVVRLTPSGWSKPRLVHADGWKIAGCPVNGPQLDARGKRVVAAWYSAAGERAHAYVAFSDDAGATFGTPVVIDDGAPAGRMDVVLVDDENAVVTWLEQAELRARRVPRNGKPGPSVRPAAHATGFARAAVVGQDVYVAWTEQSGAAKRVHVSRVRL